MGVLGIGDDAERERVDKKAHIGGRFVGDGEGSLMVATA